MDINYDIFTILLCVLEVMRTNCDLKISRQLMEFINFHKLQH